MWPLVQTLADLYNMMNYCLTLGKNKVFNSGASSTYTSTLTHLLSKLNYYILVTTFVKVIINKLIRFYIGFEKDDYKHKLDIFGIDYLVR